MSSNHISRKKWAFGLVVGATVVLLTALETSVAQQVSGDVMKAEADRVAVVEKVKPAVVAVFAHGGQGGGSGVLISDDGYGLTNFHVVAGNAAMQCGLPDGVLYECIVVGLDKVGDVALIKLLPQPGQEKKKFPFAPMGDSDKCREGDWSLAMGNPFLLATDFTPTVTYGLISGVHRYQYPSGTLLEYTDCIQIDTSINPGNSGGPLFNMQGELIGINGRGSFDKRPRINSGVGYAISINQIKNFLGHLKSGLDSDHASLGARVTTQTDKSGIGRMEVTQILEVSDIFRRGVTYGDELVSFDGRPIFSVNQFNNVLGLFPRGWRVPMEYRRPSDRDPEESFARKEILVRLMGVQRKVLDDPDPQQPPPPKQGPKGPKGGPGGTKPPPESSPAAKFYLAKEGFANFWFNKEATKDLMHHLQERGDFTKFDGKWEFEGGIKFLKANTASPVLVDVGEDKSKENVARMKVAEFPVPYELFPLRLGQITREYKGPDGSGGLLAAFYIYRNLLIRGEKGFVREFVHGGFEPCYPPTSDRKKLLRERKLLTEVINAQAGPYIVKFFFNKEDAKEAGRLEYMEVRMEENEDPCEVYFSDYRQFPTGQWMAHRLTVVYGDTLYGTLEFNSIRLNTAE
jgi:S1-C subfamily serine protease